MIHHDNEQVPLTKENLLLRDCCLKNTDYVEGIVLYAGMLHIVPGQFICVSILTIILQVVKLKQC